MASSLNEKILKIYKSVAANPSLTSARILDVSKNKGVLLQSVWSQRNLERRVNQKFSQQHTLDANLQLVSETFPTDVATELLSSSTNDEQYKAILRQATVENSTKQFIEIWNKQHLIKNYDLAGLDVHGDVYSDAEFGSFQWSPDNEKLLYIAEKKLPKSEPFYKQKPLDKKDKKPDEETVAGNEYLYKPHWGEQLVGKHRPVVVVLDTTADTITVLPGIPDYLSPGQVLWTPDGKDVVGVARKHEPRYLGLVACTNRPSWIFLLKDGVYQNLSKDGCSVRTPRFSPNGKNLVWMERDVTGPHHNCHRLMKLNWDDESRKVETIIDVVETKNTINNGKPFYGLFSFGGLIKRCWSDDSRYLFLSTPQRSNVRSYIVNIENKTVTEIENDGSSLSILDVKNDVVAFLNIALTKPSSLKIGRFDSAIANTGDFSKIDVTVTPAIPGFENLMYQPFEHLYNQDEVRDFNSAYFGPQGGNDKSIPLIVVPHGGPHSSFANTFSLEYSVFALLGFGVLQVNYRGSTGMGAKNVEFLQGRVGDSDVKDCVFATEEVLKKYSFLDPDRIGLCGGSHGGFLVAHLSGQYADKYKAVVARNPVIDIATMFTTSDIPDWCAAVVGFPYDELLPSKLAEGAYSDFFMKMYKSSPIVNVRNVKAPTLLCLGSNDLRVPCDQGKLWYQCLKANNVTTKLLLYEDNHPLATGPVEIDEIINATLWLIEHVNKKTN